MVLRFAQPHVGSRVEVTAHRERRADEDKEQRCVRLGKRWHRLALQERLSRAAAAYCFFFVVAACHASSIADRLLASTGSASMKPKRIHLACAQEAVPACHAAVTYGDSHTPLVMSTNLQTVFWYSFSVGGPLCSCAACAGCLQTSRLRVQRPRHAPRCLKTLNLPCGGTHVHARFNRGSVTR